MDYIIELWKGWAWWFGWAGPLQHPLAALCALGAVWEIFKWLSTLRNPQPKIMDVAQCRHLLEHSLKAKNPAADTSTISQLIDEAWPKVIANMKRDGYIIPAEAITISSRQSKTTGKP